MVCLRLTDVQFFQADLSILINKSSEYKNDWAEVNPNPVILFAFTSSTFIALVKTLTYLTVHRANRQTYLASHLSSSRLTSSSL
ncbi:hypothetical protein FACS1894104_0720 [Actinomycetota bacterium]|nr:hypothetical protein FACS1894104_0720 [Actinomycetota bacterium]